MKKNLCALAVIVTVLFLLSSCAAMQWVSSPRQPVITQLAGVPSLGIASYPARLGANDHVLVKVGGDYYTPIEVNGLTNKVAMRYTSPDAISKFSVNAQNLASLCRKVWVAELGNRDFDFTVLKGMKPGRIMGQSLTGDASAGGYQSVVDIPDPLTRKSFSADTMKSLGQKYKVDAIVIIDPRVYGEIGRVVPEFVEHPSGKQVRPGNFVLRGFVDYDYELYDAKTGVKITDSSQTKAEFDTMMGLQQLEDSIVDLNLTGEPDLSAYLNGPQFLPVYSGPMKAAMIPWLSLFKPHYLATLEEVKK